MAEEPDEIVVTLRVTDALEALGVLYLIGGGVAGIIHGEIRTTLDADLVADLKVEHVEPLAAALGPDFYVDAESIREAIVSRRSFNVIHRDTMFKVDVFVPRQRPFDRSQFERRVRRVLAHDPERTAWVASAEDTVLAKLEWYQMGNRISDRQWRDILGVLKAQLGNLDVAYMRRIAPTLDAQDLLEQALDEAARE